MNADEKMRVVVVRYFLDKPSTSLKTGTCIFWKNAPASCDAKQLDQFLKDVGITTHLYLAQVYLERFKAYMSLEAMGSLGHFDFSRATGKDPMQIDIRITDLHDEQHHAKENAHHEPPKVVHCNMGPTGMACFSMLIIFETAHRVSRLAGNWVEPEWDDTWACYAFFGGFLELSVAMWEITRNNIYGATFFTVIGGSWMARGLTMILQQTDHMVKVDTPVGDAISNIFYLFFTLVMFNLNRKMNKLSMAIIGTLCIFFFLGALDGTSEVLEWIHVLIGIILFFLAFYGFMAQMVNEVYQRVIFPTFPIRKDQTSLGVNDAAGLGVQLRPNVARLRTIGSFDSKGSQDDNSDSSSSASSFSLSPRQEVSHRSFHEARDVKSM
eukprot:CAMPEP_0170642922 /NCGR_PEP_ID=MMETSP0224-20130122/41594_1 /TAXON_ID=285029 /ORGANISM="Togula jolla, Strain CCCM 725" /LENGTH=380 /DNA_ID=CAMNT_0010973683 /DNA_START=59 /DNA_END=1201 /DNA_ORIENTATION=-